MNEYYISYGHVEGRRVKANAGLEELVLGEMVKGNIKPGLLLLTPTEHNRFDHYDGSLRKES